MSENFHEQLSAHFDGEESSLHSDTPFSAEQSAELEAFEQIRENVAAPASIDSATKNRHVAAALEAFDVASQSQEAVIDLNVSGKDKFANLPKSKGVSEKDRKVASPRKNHQKWFTLAAAFILCFAGVFAFYKASSFFEGQQDTASESVAANATEDSFFGDDQEATSENADEATMVDDAITEAEETPQAPANAGQMQDFDSEAGDVAEDTSPANKTKPQTGEQTRDALEEAAPTLMTTARIPQTTMQQPLASTPSYVPKKHAGSSDLEKNTDIALSSCGEILQKQGLVLQSYAQATIDGVSGELFFLSNKTTDNEIFVDRNCVQQ